MRQPEQPPDDATPPSPPPETESTVFKTDPTRNEVGVDRGYPVKLSTDTDSFVDLEHVREFPNLAVRTSHKTEDQPFYAPFPNPTIFRLMSWYYNSSATSNVDRADSLVRDVFSAPDFDRRDLIGFSAAREAKRFKAYQRSIAPDTRVFDDEKMEGIEGDDPGPGDGEDKENADGDVVYNYKDWR